MEFLARLFPERPLASTPANDSDKIDAAPFERVRSELAAGGSAESELVILKGEAGTAPPHEPARGLPDVPEGPGPVSPETGPDVVEIPAAIRLAETKFDDLELSAPTAMAVKAYKAPAPPAEGASALDEPVAIASESESESPSINQPVLGEPHGETLRPSDPEPEAPPGLLDEVAGERAEGWRRRPLLVYLAVLALAVVAVALAAAIVGIGFDLAEKRTTAREVAARNGPVPAGPVAELIRGAGFQTAAQEALSKGNAHLESGDFERAISAYDDAIRLDPATPAAYGNRAFAYWSLGNAQAAIRDYGAAIERDPTNVVNRLNRAIAYNREGEHRLAIDDLHRVLVAQPANAAALNSRCWAHAVLAHLQEALADCDEALKLRPDDPDVLDSRGFVYLRLGRLDRAIADYNAVLKLQPKHSGALYGRGLAKIGRGDRGGGREDVSAAQAIDPDIVDTFARYGVR